MNDTDNGGGRDVPPAPVRSAPGSTVPPNLRSARLDQQAANDTYLDFMLFVRAFARANAVRDLRERSAANDNTSSNIRPL
jgi:hypothetical protein